MSKNEPVYIKCRNCGIYIEENQSLNKLYCSEKCAHTFTRCPNCGNFFPDTEIDRHNGFCSIECETIYTEDGIIASKRKEKEE
jgi:endogenous inhibitor of DNA gyrase (YacG/DUF329 family)